MKESKYFLLCVLLLVSILPVSLQAQMRGGPWASVKMDALDLTEEQQNQLTEAQKAHAREMIQLQADVKVTRLDLQQLIKEGADQSEIDQQVEKVSAAQAALLKAVANHQVRVRDILGEEKFNQWMSMRGRGWTTGFQRGGKGIQLRRHNPRRR